MEPESLKERIKFYTELLKILSIFILTVGGGIVGLVLKPNRTEVENYLLISGVGLEATFLIWTAILYLTIDRLLRRLEK